MTTKSFKIKREDRVEVITGKNRGRSGKVLKVLTEKNRVRVLVEGVNKVVRHTKGGAPGSPSGKIEKEAPIQISNVALICPKCKKTTRVAHAFIPVVGSEKQRKVRVCKKCSEHIDE